MSDAIDGGRASGFAHPQRSKFFANTAWAMLLLVLLSFPLTYYGPILTGSKRLGALRHIHAAAYFAWMLLYVWQTHLAASGRIVRHREIGLFGAVLVGTMIVMGAGMALAAAAERTAAGVARPYESTWYNVVDLANFAGFMLAAIATATRRIEWHRRFTFTAAVNLVGPAFSRWTLKLPLASPLLDMAPNVLADLFLVLLAAHERRRQGRVHSATWLAIAVTVPLHVVSPWIALGAWWNALAPRLFG
jgi:hypothetical protein